MTEAWKNPSQLLENSGIRGIFIITNDGFPLIVREYGDPIKATISEQFLLSGFLSAVSRFVIDQVAGLLSDMGLHTLRLFFDYTEELIFLMAVEEARIQLLSTYELRTLFKGTLAEAKSAISEYFSGYSESIASLVKNPEAFEKIRQDLSTVGIAIDRLVYKSYNEMMEMLQGVRDTGTH
ncbi:MAG TPA: hypothetical protein VJ044_01755 [Candidatus Hodarchaeales archaeon]|nr:hypothetical protein [Candidatus Hodarchaeales archaeon]